MTNWNCVKIENAATKTALKAGSFCGLKFTEHKQGQKMAGFFSLSTSPAENAGCMKRSSIRGSICSKCYSFAMNKQYPKLAESLKRNSEILSGSILPVESLPILPFRYFRFESFGDIMNENQVMNYCNICKKNPHTRFAVWTKRPDIYARVLKEINKPDNLNILLSSVYLNCVRKNRYDFVDGVFTVYDADYIEANEININCGGRNCASCLRCYAKHDEFFYVNEKLK